MLSLQIGLNFVRFKQARQFLRTTALQVDREQRLPSWRFLISGSDSGGCLFHHSAGIASRQFAGEPSPLPTSHNQGLDRPRPHEKGSVVRRQSQGVESPVVANLAQCDRCLFNQKWVGFSRDDSAQIVDRFGDALFAEQEYGPAASLSQGDGQAPRGVCPRTRADRYPAGYRNAGRFQTEIAFPKNIASSRRSWRFPD